MLGFDWSDPIFLLVDSRKNYFLGAGYCSIEKVCGVLQIDQISPIVGLLYITIHSFISWETSLGKVLAQIKDERSCGFAIYCLYWMPNHFLWISLPTVIVILTILETAKGVFSYLQKKGFSDYCHIIFQPCILIFWHLHLPFSSSNEAAKISHYPF